MLPSICLVVVLVVAWVFAGRMLPKLRAGRLTRLTPWVVALRGSVLGLAVAIFLAVGLAQGMGPAHNSYYFPALATGLAMLFVPFAGVGAVLMYLKESRPAKP